MNELQISKKIENHFGFLFDHGFRIRSVKYFPQHMGNWIAMLESQDCLIDITSDRGEILLSFGSKNYETQDLMWFDINTVVFYLSNGQVIIDKFEGQLMEKDKQFQRLANILKTYLNQIIAIMGSDFEKHKTNLLQARKVLRDLYLERHKASKNSF